MRNTILILLALPLSTACTTARATQPVAYSTEITCDAANDTFEIKPERLENDVDSVTINGKRIETKKYDYTCQLKEVSIKLKINYDQKPTAITEADAPEIYKPIIQQYDKRYYLHSKMDVLFIYNSKIIAAIGDDFKKEPRLLFLKYINKTITLKKTMLNNTPLLTQEFKIHELLHHPVIKKTMIGISD